jgi:hypothetical protein
VPTSFHGDKSCGIGKVVATVFRNSRGDNVGIFGSLLSELIENFAESFDPFRFLERGLAGILGSHLDQDHVVCRLEGELG